MREPVPRDSEPHPAGLVARPAPRRVPAPELRHALAAIVLVTLLYALAYVRGDDWPAASGLIGHSIGVAGFVLMVMTATLYSLRKLRTDARWGSTAAWLRFHMVTGLVGPYMVLLHTAMRFEGLAGFAMLLTAVVVASGLTGRYLYTALARDGGGGSASGRLARRRRAFATWHLLHVPLAWALFAAAFVHIVAALYYATLQR